MAFFSSGHIRKIGEIPFPRLRRLYQQHSANVIVSSLLDGEGELS
jgi:hypothetical protein